MAMLNDEEMEEVYKLVCAKMADGLREQAGIDEEDQITFPGLKYAEQCISDLDDMVRERDARIKELEAARSDQDAFINALQDKIQSLEGSRQKFIDDAKRLYCNWQNPQST